MSSATMTEIVGIDRIRVVMTWWLFPVVGVFVLLSQSPEASFALCDSAFLTTGPSQETHQNDERDDGDDGSDLVPKANGAVEQDCCHMGSPRRVKSTLNDVEVWLSKFKSVFWQW